jgi:hypothetical protein
LGFIGGREAIVMGMASRLDVLPTFPITAISSEAETTLVTGIFSRPERVAVEDRGWLFISETASNDPAPTRLGGLARGDERRRRA